MNKISIELLSPAKDLETGIAAINCGADAVYIGAPKFGARSAVGNSIDDIKKLVDYAHKFWVKIYVTVNTIIYDNELEEVKNLITSLYKINVDAIIFQDMALLEMKIPPIQLYASTQTHNYELERIKSLDSLGIKRIILARELSLEQLKEIKNSTTSELEFFIHGALCVCLSGQCYMSAAMFGRSANRGECAQSCRLEYSLVDRKGTVIVKDKHLLSLRDLNLSAYLNELIEAGITSFKIEGRLKDISYVKNITAYYRQQLDSILKNNNSLKKSSSGDSIIPFDPDPDKTFNRGYTSYFIDGKDEQLSSINTPKSKGKFLGKVAMMNKSGFEIDTREEITAGDGLCFLDENGKLTGMSVNKSEKNFVFTKDLAVIKKGLEIYRNYDHEFSNQLKKEGTRKIKAKITVEEIPTGLRIVFEDEDGVITECEKVINKEPAKNPEKASATLIKNFSKSGDTIFNVTEVRLKMPHIIFLPMGEINEIRRKILDMAENERIRIHNKNILRFDRSALNKSVKKIDYKYNVVNVLSNRFYKNAGAEKIEEGFELQNKYGNKTLMSCKYCIKDELGVCPKVSNESFDEPLYLVNNKNKYKLVFNCKDCQMEVVFPHTR